MADQIAGVGEGPSRGVTRHVGAQDAIWECQECGADFGDEARRRGQRYCSARCKDKAYNRRNPVHRQAALDFDSPSGWTPAQREQSAHLRKRESKAKAIVARLEHGPATTLELSWVGGIRFSARLHELEKDGFRYQREDRGDYSIYTMTRRPNR